MDGYQRRTEKKMQAIEQAAFDLFCEKGVEAANIMDIASKANVSQVSIYNYYNNKSGLLAAVIIKAAKQLFENTQAVIEHPTYTFYEKIEGLMKNSLSTHQRFHPSFIKAMGAIQDETARAFLRDVRGKTIDMLIKLFQEGKDKGAIDPSYDDASILEFIGLYQHLNKPHVLQNPKMLNDVAKMFFYGIAKK